jgi:serine/threonine protein kinase
MGTVYVGRDTQLGNRLVAIKEMSQNGLLFSERLEAARSFAREAHLLAGLQHPNLPSIYDHFEEGQRWYLVMSFIKGQALTHYLDMKGGRLAVGEVLEIGIALCSVLGYLHTHHPPIIFRDLKPANIMRTVDGHIYLIDFGIARFFKPGQTLDTANQGSSGYASPEQYGTAQTTPRSDIYSLGATVYRLLSGYEPAYNPFRLPPLQSFVPAAPPRLAALITRMLDLDEIKRPDSAEIVKWELQNILNDIDYAPSSPPLSSPPSSPLSLPQPPAPKKKNWGLPVILVGAIAVIVFATLYLIIGNLNTRDIHTPYGVVNTFCNALNSQSPDFQTAYNLLSRHYQQEHSLITFQEYLLGTTQCTIASPPNGNNQAGISLTMVCPPPPPPNAPPSGPGPPPPPNAPPPRPGPPPPRINPVNLTLINDGSDGWKIDNLYLVGHNCSLPDRPLQTNSQHQGSSELFRNRDFPSM